MTLTTSAKPMSGSQSRPPPGTTTSISRRACAESTSGTAHFAATLLSMAQSDIAHPIFGDHVGRIGQIAASGNEVPLPFFDGG